MAKSIKTLKHGLSFKITSIFIALLISSSVLIMTSCNKDSSQSDIPVSTPGSEISSDFPATSSEEIVSSESTTVPESSSMPELPSSSEESSSSEVVSSSEPPKVTAPTVPGFTIAQSGEYNDSAEYSSMMIKADNVTISNKTIHGDLNIHVPKGSGYINLYNVIVEGKINITAGSSNLTLDTVSAPVLRVASADGTPLIDIKNTTGFDKTYVYCNALLRQSNISADSKGFNNIGIGGDANSKSWQEVYLDNVTNAYLTVNFPANVRLLGTTNLKEVYAYKKAHFYDEGNIDVLYALTNGISYNNLSGKVYTGDGIAVTQGGVTIGSNPATNTTNTADTDRPTEEKTLPKLTAPTVLSAPQASAGVVTLKFNSVSNAITYQIVTYKNGEIIANHVQAATNQANYIFMSDKDYQVGDTIYFQIIALGDDRNYANSDWVTTSSIVI